MPNQRELDPIQQLREQKNNNIVLENDVVCFECGVKYLSEQQKQSGGNAVTFHEDKCCECGEVKSVTSVRHYNYLQKIY